MVRKCSAALVFSFLLALMWGLPTVGAKIRVLIVGGDWRSQLPDFIRTQAGWNYYQAHNKDISGVKHPSTMGQNFVSGKNLISSAVPKSMLGTAFVPLRGYFIKQQVNKVAPGKFSFTLWTTYRFLQYGDAQSLKRFDVIVEGDMQHESILPRLVRGVTAFVKGGGGIMFTDAYKPFFNYSKALSFHAVMPVKVGICPHYGGPNTDMQLLAAPVKIVPVSRENPIMRGLHFANAPTLTGAHWNPVQKGSVVLAKSGTGQPLWVVRQVGQGRAFWCGGVFANDQYSTAFAQKWPQFGQFYAQALSWLAAHSTYPPVRRSNATATGTLTVNWHKPGPLVTSRLFGIHGSQGTAGYNAAALKLLTALRINGSFARNDAWGGQGAGINYVAANPAYAKMQKKLGDKFWKSSYIRSHTQYENCGVSLTHFNWSQFNFKGVDKEMAQAHQTRQIPLMMWWMDWSSMWGHPATWGQWTKYFAAEIQHFNGTPGTAAYKPRLKYVEICNEPGYDPLLCRFYNYVASRLHARYPGLSIGGFGGGGAPSDFEAAIKACGKQLNWINAHPYGMTGQAIFRWERKYIQYARSIGDTKIKFNNTEWDFWVYGADSFDSIMQYWKPEIRSAGFCLGTLHYCWPEYQEGGYDFGMIGGWGIGGSQLPPQWPDPAQSKPLTFKYNAFWIMRNCRGKQYATKLSVPVLKTTPSHYAWAVTTRKGNRLNIVVYYGFPYTDLANAKRYTALHVHLNVAIPPQVTGRTMVTATANDRVIATAAPTQIHGNHIRMTVTVPALSGVSITVK
jgi:hypothetical protein